MGFNSAFKGLNTVNIFLHCATDRVALHITDNKIPFFKLMLPAKNVREERIRNVGLLYGVCLLKQKFCISNFGEKKSLSRPKAREWDLIRASFISTVPSAVKNAWTDMLLWIYTQEETNTQVKIQLSSIWCVFRQHHIQSTTLHNTSSVKLHHSFPIVIKWHWKKNCIYLRASSLGSEYNVWCCVPHTNNNTACVSVFNYATENETITIIFNNKIFSTTVKYCVEITIEMSSQNKGRLHSHVIFYTSNRNLDIMIIKQKPALLNKVARLCIFQYETYITNRIHKRGNQFGTS